MALCHQRPTIVCKPRNVFKVFRSRDSKLYAIIEMPVQQQIWINALHYTRDSNTWNRWRWRQWVHIRWVVGLQNAKIEINQCNSMQNAIHNTMVIMNWSMLTVHCCHTIWNGNVTKKLHDYSRIRTLHAIVYGCIRTTIHFVLSCVEFTVLC